MAKTAKRRNSRRRSSSKRSPPPRLSAPDSSAPQDTTSTPRLVPAVSADSDERVEPKSNHVHVRVKEIYEIIVDEFSGKAEYTGTSLNYFNAALQSKRETFLTSDVHEEDKIGAMFSLLFSNTNNGRNENALKSFLLKKRDELMSRREEDLSSAESEMKRGLDIALCDIKEIKCKGSTIKKCSELRGKLLSFLVTTTMALSMESGEDVVAAQTVFVAFLDEAVLIDRASLATFKAAFAKYLDAKIRSESEIRHWMDVLLLHSGESDSKFPYKKLLVGILFDAGSTFDYLFDAMESKHRFGESLELSDAKKFILDRFIPSESWARPLPSHEMIRASSRVRSGLLLEPKGFVVPSMEASVPGSAVVSNATGMSQPAPSDTPGGTLIEPSLSGTAEELGAVFSEENILKNELAWKICHPSKEFKGSEPTTVLEIAGAGKIISDNDYYILKLLGRGATASVFEAILKNSPGIHFAVKVQAIDPTNFYKLFVKPLALHSRLSIDYAVHPLGWHIFGAAKTAKMLSAAKTAKSSKRVLVTVALAMELGKETLETFRENLVEAFGPQLSKFSESEAAKNILYTDLLKEILPKLHEILKCLQHSHGKDVIHRDVKTENVLLVDDNWKLSDFGVAKDEKLCDNGATKNQGTDGYQAPEARSAIYSTKTDMYSFGAVFYEMIVGHLPNENLNSGGPFDEGVFRHPKFGGDLKKLIGKLLSDNPGERQDAPNALCELEALEKKL